MTSTSFTPAAKTIRPTPAGGVMHPVWINIALTLAAMLILIPLGFWLRPDGGTSYETPKWAIYIHLATVIPGLPLGAWVLWSRKGTPAHKMAGRVWAMMMVITAIDSFWIRSLTGGISPIHIFSVITLVSIPRGIYYARIGNIAGHVSAMRGVYIGLVIAGLAAMVPGRFLSATIFG